jgi:O-succinylbenzoate synthase
MAERPTLTELLDSAVPFALPLQRPFRGLRLREGVLIQGPSGWGEFAPFDDYSDRAAARWLDSAIEAAFGQWPTPVRQSIPVNAILPAVSADVAADLTRAAVRDGGCSTIKVKVGSASLADDEARVAAVRRVLTELLGPGGGSIRIDANGAWDVEHGRQALTCLAPFDIEYVEQPCRTREEMVRLRPLVDVRFAVDELIRWSDEPVTSVRDIADVAVLKPATLGGAAAALRLADRSRWSSAGRSTPRSVCARPSPPLPPSRTCHSPAASARASSSPTMSVVPYCPSRAPCCRDGSHRTSRRWSALARGSTLSAPSTGTGG